MSVQETGHGDEMPINHVRFLLATMSPPEPIKDVNGKDLSEEELRSVFNKRIKRKARELAKELPRIEGKRSLLLACVALWTSSLLQPYVKNVIHRIKLTAQGAKKIERKEHTNASGLKTIEWTYVYKDGSKGYEFAQKSPDFYDASGELPGVIVYPLLGFVGYNVVYKSLKNIAARHDYYLPDELIEEALELEMEKVKKYEKRDNATQKNPNKSVSK